LFTETASSESRDGLNLAAASAKTMAPKEIVTAEAITPSDHPKPAGE
jgi:hypothetical protein